MKKLILLLALSCNIYANDFINEIHAGFDKFNDNPIVKIDYTRNKPETAEEASVRLEREKDEINDVKLNKAEVADSRYYVNKQWVSTKYKVARNENELKDSDNDGYDDYTEFVNGTNPHDKNSFPQIRNGNNKRIFK